MFVVISPAKKLHEATPMLADATQPRLLDKTKMLIDELRGYSAEKIADMMKISPNLSRLNQQRFADFTFPMTKENSLLSLYMFAGDTYVGLDAVSWSVEDVNYAQAHLGILSGLFGLLRPKDLVQPYRLEMGTQIQTDAGKNLYEFWKQSIANLIDVEKHGVVVNCASQEYFGAIASHIDAKKIMTPIFLQKKGDSYKVISFSAKRARGALARYIIQNRIIEIQKISNFTYDGYVYKETIQDEGTKIIFTKE